MSDNSSLLPASAPFAHFLEFFCLHGAPGNAPTNHRVSIEVNHGYALGYSPDREQPLWTACQVAAAVRDLDFQRPILCADAQACLGADRPDLRRQSSRDRPAVWPLNTITPANGDPVVNDA